MRRLMLSVSATLVVSAALALPVAARVEGGCGNGQAWERFFVGLSPNAQAFADAYPSVQRALDDGVYSLADLTGQLDARDRNDNGWVCVKDVYEHANQTGNGFFYFVNAVDDNAAPK